MCTMESNTPTSYKNFLPSKNIRITIGILLLIGLLYFLIPLIIKKIATHKSQPESTAQIKITTPVGDPTSRDTDGDGVLDWQEIALGLDVNSPETKPGVPDYQTFLSLKKAIGQTTFENELSQVTDTDKMSLTIYDTLSKDSIVNNGVTNDGVASVTGQELYNYIEAQQKTIKKYTPGDFEVVEGNLSENQKYGKAIQVLSKDSPEDKKYPTTIKNYIDGTVSKNEVLPVIQKMNTLVQSLTSIPIPRAVLAEHITLINSLQGISQILDTFPGDADELRKLSSASLIQDYLINATKSLGMISIYLSYALDKGGYAQ